MIKSALTVYKFRNALNSNNNSRDSLKENAY